MDGENLNVEPLPAAPGQEPFGSWASVKAILRGDPLYGVLLVLMAVNVLFQVVSQAWFGALIGTAVLWGLLTFRWWGYWLVMVSSGMAVVAGLFAFMGADSSAGRYGMLVAVVAYALVMVLLYTRRDRFG